MPVRLYLLKVGVALLLIALFYLVFLQRLTFYRWNRWYLAGGAVLAFVLPFLNVYDFLDPQAAAQTHISSIPSLQMVLAPVEHQPGTGSPELGLESMALSLILTGMLVLFIRLMLKLASYHRLKKKCGTAAGWGCKDLCLDPFPFAVFFWPFHFY